MTANAFDTDIFTMTSLTAAVNSIPYAPTGIQELNIYEASGINTLNAYVEVLNGSLSVYSVKPRGAEGQTIADDKRVGYSFRVPHIPAAETIHADEVIGVRQFGTEEISSFELKRNDVLTRLRRAMDYTLEYHRVQNILGNFIDANNTAVSLFTTFGLVEQSFDADLDDTDQAIDADCVTYLTAMEDGLGDTPFTGALALCGSTFWSAFRGHATVKAQWLNTPMAGALRSDVRQPIEFGGITWMRYRGTSAVKIPDAEARIIPLGVPGMYVTRYAPANYADAVGTMGLPFYSVGEPLPLNKGVKIEVQSNPLNLITRPRAIIKLYT